MATNNQTPTGFSPHTNGSNVNNFVNPFASDETTKDIKWIPDIDDKYTIEYDEWQESSFLVIDVERLTTEEQKLSEKEFINHLKNTPLGTNYDYIILKRIVYNKDLKPIYTCHISKCGWLEDISKVVETEVEDGEGNKSMKNVSLSYKIEKIVNDKVISEFLKSDEYNRSQLLNLF